MSSTNGSPAMPMREPRSVVIPLDDRGKKSRDSSRDRKSSTSTSSFEDLNDKGDATPRRLSEVSKHSRKSQQSLHSHQSAHSTGEPATIDVDDVDMAENTTSQPASSSPKGALSFKTTSFDDPQFYAQPESPSHSFKSSKGNIHSCKQGKKGTDRDPENVNDIVKIRFEEIFAEPEGTYSFGTIWGATYRIFTDSKIWCYKFLSALCGVPCALCWGIHFACLSFCQIWYYQPSIRSFTIQVRPCARMFGIFIRAFAEPCFMAIGRIFSSIKLNVTRNDNNPV